MTKVIYEEEELENVLISEQLILILLRFMY